VTNMINPAKFFREVRQEAARVTWPTRKEVTTSTIMVLVLAIVAAVFFLAVDFVIGVGVENILGFAQ
jgi:preprotein translocase subunit SecE